MQLSAELAAPKQKAERQKTWVLAAVVVVSKAKILDNRQSKGDNFGKLNYQISHETWVLRQHATNLYFAKFGPFVQVSPGIF